MIALRIILIFVGSYLLGSIVTSDIVTRFKKVDLRNKGSGNIGATNAFRVMGSFYGSIVLIGDALKGVIAVLLGKTIGSIYGFDFAIITGILAIVGHNWPVFTGFRGGKGVATSLGVVIALTPLALIVSIPTWLIIFIIFGFVSLASILAAASYPVAVYILYPHDVYKLIFAILLGALAIYRHKSNIKRLLNGEENRILYQKRGAKDK